MKKILTALVIATTLFTASARAETYVVSAQPGTLQALINTGNVVSGDTIILQDGNYGLLDLRLPAFSAPVTIRAEHKGKAHADYIGLREGMNVEFADIAVWPTNPYTHYGAHVETWPATSNITFSGMNVRGGVDAAAFPNWSITEWSLRAANGIVIEGTNSVVSNSVFTGVRFGVTLLGEYNRATGNVINGFAGDGLRTGSHSIFTNNTIKNCVSIDENHADGLQAYAGAAGVTDVVIDRNWFLEWNLAPNPLTCGLQGIGMFDGPFSNIIIRNNVVSISNGHGITVRGLDGGKLLFNTVVSANGLPATLPWIAIYPALNGTPSKNVIVANNLAMGYAGQTDMANAVLFTDNGVIGNPATAFEDLKKFVPTASSGFADSANSTYSLKGDTNRHVRPFGPNPDKGAVEVGSTVLVGQ